MPHVDLLSRAVEAGAARLEHALGSELPATAPAAFAWLRSLTAAGRLADYFRHPSRFPMLALPWWAAGPDRDDDFEFHADIVASTMAGYYYVRLIDDLVDRQPGVSINLLPLTALLHTEFETPYRRHFPPASPFWPLFRSAWLASADAMVPGAGGSALSPEALLERATATIGAVVIPLRAVTLATGVADRFEPWREVVFDLARAEQLLDDLVDWQVDCDRSLPNILLAEAGRRSRPDEAAPAWMVREGYRWGLTAVKERLAALAGPVAALGSAPLAEFLAARVRAVSALEEQTGAGLAQFAALAEAFGRPNA